MKTEEFKVFRGAADMKGGRVVALRVPNGAKFSRKEIDEYTKFVGIYGAKGLALHQSERCQQPFPTAKTAACNLQS